MPLQKTPAAGPLLLYALTGFAGVLAEQGFEKYIALLVGATVFSSAIVIFAYFLGLSLGAWAVAAFARRKTIARPLRIYGLLELLVGVSCVVFSYGFHPLTTYLAPFQSPTASTLQLFLTRFAFGATLILPSAILMGASFPLIAQVVNRHNNDNGKLWVLAYGCNLGGAVLAAVAGAYLILPAIGIRGALWLCFAIGALVFAACLLLPEPDPRSADESLAVLPHEPVRESGLLLFAAFSSGLIFFALEILWTHLIGTLLGASIYAFACMLASVLLGLLLGSLRAQRSPEAYRAANFSRLFQFSALLLIVQLRLWDYSQAAFLIDLPAWIKSFYTIEGFKFLLAAILIVPPATLLGSLYPILLRNPALVRPGTGYFVGYLNMANSFGCLAGALLGVFFFIPVLGSEWSLRIISILLLAIGLVFLWRTHPPSRVFAKALAGGVLVIGYAFWFTWNPLLLTSGLNVYFGRTAVPAASHPGTAAEPPAQMRMVFFEEHAQGGFTSVLEESRAGRPTKHVLLTNGKYEGADDLEEQGFAQISVGALPTQFASNLDRSLVIGLGTGHSAHSLAQMGFRQVDIAEFAPGIVHAAAQRFQSFNGGVLTDPHVRLHLEDGRNFLLVAPPNTFDVISVEITSVWFAGATNVYSREFYGLVRSRLRPGGSFQQWVQFHHISPREIAVEIATLRSVFPYVSLWNGGGQGMLVATASPQTLTATRRAYMEQRLRLLTGASDSKLQELQNQIFNSRILDPPGIDRLLKAGYPAINTDHNRWIEYATPRYNWSDFNWEPGNLAWLKSFALPDHQLRESRIVSSVVNPHH